MCNGQVLSIAQNTALFALLGTTYGGNGTTTFALPDLRGRLPMHAGGGFVRGQSGGEASHTLTITELPAHSHAVTASSAAATTTSPAGARLAVANNVYAAPTNLVALVPAAVSSFGGSQPHENRQPYLALTFCIALQGLFPSQN
jgi:microcystin-dependent protein